MNNSVDLQDLGNSIDKVKTIIDINISKQNDMFLVDNFKNPCVLRNTNLRTQFNTICKGKQESREINNTEVKQCNKIFLCKEEQIRDIPNILLSLFDTPKKYYIYGTPTNYSFFQSLLLLIEKDYILFSRLEKEKKIDDIRNKMVFTLEENYKKFNYKQKKFKKSIIRDNLLNSKIFLPQVINYVVDYYNICLLIIDTESYLYSLIGDYSLDKNYILMLRKNNYYQPIMNIEGNNLFTYNLLDKLSVILDAEFTIDKTISDKKEEKIDIDELINIIQKDGLLKENKYKLVVLQEIAKYYNIDIKNGNRNKKKSDLYQEIKTSKFN